jgi:23S rRNA (adenine2503-C2)-methyltransferase
MGMGEPLANYDATLRAVRWLVDANGMNLRQRSITISTIGLLRAVERLAGEQLQIGLTISLHAPDDALRHELIPTSRGVSIRDLIAAGRSYVEQTGRRVTFAYALLGGVNDHPSQARRLAQQLGGFQCHVNLIPYNPIGVPELRRPDRGAVRAFQRELQAAGINATVRIERGVEIAAACGQLRTDVALGT